MSLTHHRPFRHGLFPRLEALEDRTAPALLTATILIGEIPLPSERGADCGQEQSHLDLTISTTALDVKIAAVSSPATSSISFSPPASSASATTKVEVQPTGSTLLSGDSNPVVSPNPTLTATLGSTSTSVSKTSLTAVGVGSIPVESTGSSSGDGSSGTKLSTASQGSTTAVQVAPAVVDRTSAASPMSYFLSAAAISGASGSRSAEAQGEGNFPIKGDESGRGTVLAVEAISGQTAEGNAEVDDSSASLPPSPAALNLSDAGDLPSPGDVAASLVGAGVRAEVLPEKGSRLSVAATAVAFADPLAVEDADGNLRANLFVGPLTDLLGTAALPSTEGAPAGFSLSDEAGTDIGAMHVIALATVTLAAALVWGMQRKNVPEEEKANLVRL